MKAILLSTLVLLTACSTMEWQKAGVSPDTAMSEWANCRRDAERRVPPDFRAGAMGTVGTPNPIVGPSGVVGYEAPQPSFRESDVLAMAQGCMNDKGYKLVSVGK